MINYDFNLQNSATIEKDLYINVSIDYNLDINLFSNIYNN